MQERCANNGDLETVRFGVHWPRTKKHENTVSVYTTIIGSVSGMDWEDDAYFVGLSEWCLISRFSSRKNQPFRFPFLFIFVARDNKFEWIVQGALDVLARAHESGELTKPRPQRAVSPQHMRTSPTPPPRAPSSQGSRPGSRAGSSWAGSSIY